MNHERDWKGRAVYPPPGVKGEPLRLLKAGGGFLQPDIWVVGAAGSERVWKTWWRRPAWERRLIGRRLARHEAGIIAALQDVEGFPTLLSQPDCWTVEMSLLDAEPVPEVKSGGALTSGYFKRLEAMLATMHERGINHGDLRRKNFLRAPGDPDTPRVVDFTQCLHFTPPVRGWRRIVLNEARCIDRVTFLKLKLWFLGKEELSEDEYAELKRVPWHLAAGRFLRQKLYRPFKHWRKRRARRDKSG